MPDRKSVRLYAAVTHEGKVVIATGRRPGGNRGAFANR
jgi:hypothetical protein